MSKIRKTQCWIELQPWQWKVYMTLVAITVFLIPAIIITACYTIIVYTIWTKSKVLSPVKQTDTNKSQEDHDIRRSSSRGIIPRAKIKTVKMTFVIVFVFILCWSPYIIFDLLQAYGYIPPTQTNVAIATLIQSLAPLNSAANPVIYCLFSTRICNSLSKTIPFSWLRCCKERPAEPASCTETLTSSSHKPRSMSMQQTRNLSHFSSSCPIFRPDVSFFVPLSQFSSSCLNFRLDVSFFVPLSQISSSCLIFRPTVSNFVQLSQLSSRC
ncbi:hypothetical protein V9T40_003714 [Parthenolecanium corni]|uniref:G-protein coupled receptors family 1 profile domain-containing protein n=1 Tax=Parthenolecanium corni TaxID=536013 RepID=A0AAN9TVU7_9HEMI